MKWLQWLKTVIFSERCPYCGELVEPFEIACGKCYDEIRRKHLPIRSGARGYRCVSTFAYDGKVRRMILLIKYHNRVQFIPQVAELLAGDIRKTYGDNAFDLITYVPMHRKDFTERDYNQSELLAKALSELLSVPCREALMKVKRTKKQHTLKYAERKTNLSGAFQLIEKDLVKGQRILIVDDIITSGYTLGNCCKVLSRGKPELICCATIASAHEKYPEATVI